MYRWLTVLCVAIIPFLAPESAHAYPFYRPTLLVNVATQQACPGPNCNDVIKNINHDKVTVCPGSGLTRRIMPCIKETILAATYSYLIPFSTYISAAIGAMCTLAVVVWGISMAAGKQGAPMRDSVVLLVKIAAVIMFTVNFGGLFSQLLDIMEGLLGLVTNFTLVSNYFGNTALQQANTQVGNFDLCPIGSDTGSLLVWDAVDCTVNTLTGGIFSTTTVAMGIIGFFVACLKSTGLGVMIGLFGIYVIIQFLFAIFRALYIFLASYIGLSLMVIISPLFIPMILFQVTKGYFSKWLRLTLSFMIQPLFLFAYMSMLLAAFDVAIWSGSNSVFVTLCGEDKVNDVLFDLPVSQGGKGGIGTCLLQMGAYGQKDILGKAINVETSENPYAPTNSANTGTGDQIAKAAIDKLSVSCDPSFGGDDCPTFENDPQGTTCVGSDAQGKGKCYVNGTIFQKSIMDTLGGTPAFFLAALGQMTTVDFNILATKSGILDENGQPSATGYALKLLLSVLMAFMVSYIFLKLLDHLPAMASSLANYNIDPSQRLNMASPMSGVMSPPGQGWAQLLGGGFPGTNPGGR